MTAHCLKDGCTRTWPRDPATEIACPDCGAGIGKKCKRPSGRCGLKEDTDGGTGEAPAPPNRNKIKYSHECAALGDTLNVWGKPELPIICGACSLPYAGLGFLSSLPIYFDKHLVYSFPI
jgi:hypothetical protein